MCSGELSGGRGVGAVGGNHLLNEDVFQLIYHLGQVQHLIGQLLRVDP